MRYVTTAEEDVSLARLGRVLQDIDPAYSITSDGDLMHGDGLYAQLEVNCAGEGIFREEMPELVESAEDAQGPGREAVLRVLRNARAVIAIQVLWQGREAEATLQRIEPLCDWLLANRKGLLQVDGEGYYDGSGLILRVE
jgi:sugar/nucleoside kinase (ribokinase family)